MPARITEQYDAGGISTTPLFGQDLKKCLELKRVYLQNRPKQPMNSQTANAALKRIGYGGKLVAHSLRSIASTAMNEEGFNSDVIEAELSHSDKNEVRKAYNRSVYLKQRYELMNWWGNTVSAFKQ